MNTLHLKYAVEVERTGSITRAADNLYMAQPNLSKAIKELEASLNIQLFKRTAKGVMPTAKGAEFLSYARRILAQIDEMESCLRAESEGKQVFSISIPHGSYITKAFMDFAETLDVKKHMDIHVVETNPMHTMNNVADGHTNLGILRYQVQFESYFLDFLNTHELVNEPIMNFEYVLVISQNHPLAHAREIHKEDLTHFVEVNRGDTTVPFLSAEENRKLNEKEQSHRRICLSERGNQLDLLARMNTAYMWASPIPEDYLHRSKLTQRVCSAAANQYKDVLIYRKDYRFTPLDKVFLAKLHESLKQVQNSLSMHE